MSAKKFFAACITSLILLSSVFVLASCKTDEEENSAAFMFAFANLNKSERIYTVTFNSDNNSDPVKVTVSEGSLVAEPKAPEKESCNFLYWADEKGSKFDFTKPVTKSMTLKAIWEQYYIVKFNANNGSEVTSVKVVGGGYGSRTCISGKRKQRICSLD